MKTLKMGWWLVIGFAAVAVAFTLLGIDWERTHSQPQVIQLKEQLAITTSQLTEWQRYAGDLVKETSIIAPQLAEWQKYGKDLEFLSEALRQQSADWEKQARDYYDLIDWYDFVPTENITARQALWMLRQFRFTHEYYADHPELTNAFTGDAPFNRQLERSYTQLINLVKYMGQELNMFQPEPAESAESGNVTMIAPPNTPPLTPPVSPPVKLR